MVSYEQQMKKRILLVRHGQSVGNVNHAFYSERPDYAISLTEKGQQQALERGQELAKLSGDFAVFVSTHFRTRQTLHQIKKSIGDRIVSEVQTPLIREQEWSNVVGKHADLELEKERLSWGVFHYRFPGGESCADVFERIKLFNDDLFRELIWGTAENVLVVGHGMAMRIHLMTLLGYTVEEFELMRNPWNCGVFELEWDSSNQAVKDGHRKVSLISGLRYRPNRSHVFEFSEEKIDVLGETQIRIHPDWMEDFA